MFNLRNRSLLTVQDYTAREFRYLLDLARDLKRAKYARTEQKHLKDKEICLIFEKTSTRTRCAFEIACYDLAGPARRRSSSWPRTPACPSSTGSRPNTIPPRCSPTS
jgi:ornithine carbamoyltransferase